MPGTRCTVAACKNSRLKAKQQGEDVSFFAFPKEVTVRQEWVAKCKRSGNWNPGSCHVCSVHFREEDFERDLKSELLGLPKKRKTLKSGAVPSLHLEPGKDQVPPTSGRAKRVQKRKQKELVPSVLSAHGEIEVPLEGNGFQVKGQKEVVTNSAAVSLLLLAAGETEMLSIPDKGSICEKKIGKTIPPILLKSRRIKVKEGGCQKKMQREEVDNSGVVPSSLLVPGEVVLPPISHAGHGCEKRQTEEAEVSGEVPPLLLAAGETDCENTWQKMQNEAVNHANAVPSVSLAPEEVIVPFASDVENRSLEMRVEEVETVDAVPSATVEIELPPAPEEEQTSQKMMQTKVIKILYCPTNINKKISNVQTKNISMTDIPSTSKTSECYILKQQNNSLLKKNECLEEELQDCRQTVLAINERLRKERKLRIQLEKQIKTLKKNESRHLNMYMRAKLSGTLTANQIDIVLKHKKKVRWTLDEIERAFAIRYFSKRCYLYLKKTLKYPLPGVSTLQKCALNMGISESGLDQMFKFSKATSTSKKNKNSAAALSECEAGLSEQVGSDVVYPHEMLIYQV